MNIISFNYVVDHGETFGYESIVYVNKDGEELSFEKWVQLSFLNLSQEGYFKFKEEG
ncbi:hypothetical protein [Cytobacillus oceanisediminis]|uniref:hypothetical protein n=1 Tax=Cytobacillus oceanisediminis TaxID=665099 RepID=UPI001FB4DBDF|nr:hypothetical protein [Cytobacillus oceanisediminis]UOE58116.1 hypothetical protein IRB79_26780 [Cytobacillus oceanisediminis]